MDIKHPSRSESQHTLASPQAPGFFATVNVLRSVKSHALIFALITLSVLGLGAGALFRHQRYYEATSVIYVSPTFPATFTPDHEQERPYESYIEEQAHTITRYEVMVEALHKLKPGIWQVPGESEESAVEHLQRSITAKRDGLTYQVEITIGGYKPDYLAEIVNTVTNSFLERVKNEEFYGRDERLDALRQARAEVQKQLDNDLREQAAISQQLGVAVIGDDNSDALDAQVVNLRAELAAAREARIQAEAKLSALANADPNTPNPALNAAADEIIALDPGLLALKSSLSQKRAMLMDQLAGLTPNHPLRKATEAQLTEIEAGLQQMQTDLRRQASINLEQRLRTELRRAQTVEGQLLSDLQSYTRQASTAAPSFQRADVLKTEIGSLQARYAALDERTRNLELEGSSPGSVHMFSLARTPTVPLPSKAKKFGPVLIPLALCVGIISVVLIDSFDPRIYSGTDVERILGFTPIGMIFDEQEVSMLVFDECTLRLAAGVDHAVRTAGVRTVVLTSVHPGAGTTSIVEDLGSTLAKLGRKTLTIDASGATSPVAYVTLCLNRPPQSDNGSYRTRPDVALHPTSVVAQPFTPRLTPLTNFMDQAFKDLTNEYDIVLIDATPLPISAETEYLARFADVTILVAEAGKTTKPQLTRSARLLERLQVAGIGAIINKVSLDRTSKAIREELQIFEEHVNKENLAWKPTWSQAPAPAEAVFKSHEQAVAEPRESSSFA